MERAASTRLGSREGRVTLQGLHFRHAAAGPELLAGISLDVPAGELVALVGPPGSGKTSLLRLLLGELTPTAGAVRVDGLTRAQLGPRRWRAAVAGMSAGESLCAGSIADSMAFLAPRRVPHRVAEAAERAGLQPEIAALPRAAATPIAELGDAERARWGLRLLLARSLYLRPRVLLIDDGTPSGPPEEGWRLWWRAVRALRLTRVIASHRPEVITEADRVMVLEQGLIQQDLHRAAGSLPPAM